MQNKKIIITGICVITLIGGLCVVNYVQDTEYQVMITEQAQIAEDDGVQAWNDYIEELSAAGFVYNGIGFIHEEANVFLQTNYADDNENYASVIYTDVNDEIEQIQVDGYINLETKTIEFYDCVITYNDETVEIVTDPTTITGELAELVTGAKEQIVALTDELKEPA